MREQPRYVLSGSPREGLCLLCSATVPATYGELYNNYSCRLCGEYKADEFLTDVPLNLKPALKAATRQSDEDGRVLWLKEDNLVELAQPHLRSTYSARLEKVLRWLAAKSRRPGSSVIVVPNKDYPIADAEDDVEFAEYLAHLCGKGLVRFNGDGGKATYWPTMDGWQAVEPRVVPGGTPGRCFVAMWFDPSMQEAYAQGFALGIEDAGFKPFRIDDKRSNKGISDEIKAEVRLAQFIVADFTAGEDGQRGGVYFEAGFAQGLGREVIWCCRKGEMERVHFDVKHLGHVVWDDPADLRVKLAQSIRANIISKG